MRIGRMVGALALAGLASGAGAADAPAPKTASEYYLQYHDVLRNMTTREQLLRYAPAEWRDSVMKKSDAEFERTLTLFKLSQSGPGELAVVKETPAGKGVFALQMTGLDRAGRPGTGVVRITKTAAGWKKGEETWTFGDQTETIAPSR
jgi:hypothetical protein